MESSESGSDEGDHLTHGTHTKNDLTVIASNPYYQELLTKLLDPGARSTDGALPEPTTNASADPTFRWSDQSGSGAVPTTPLTRCTAAPDQASTSDDANYNPPPAKRMKSDGGEPSTSGPL